MTTKQQTYNVAGHTFSLELEACDPLWTKLSACYAPFEVAASDSQQPLFTVSLQTEPTPTEQQAVLICKDPNPNPNEGKVDVYRTDADLLFELTPFGGGNQHSLLHLSPNFRQGKMLLRGSESDRLCGANTSLMLCYLLATASQDTLLMHASTVVSEGKAYLFLGRSGTGKSTHSRLWLQTIGGTKLLNDDHPIIRIDAQGNALAYGSPWSGKTPCYHNESAPIGGIVRIKRAPENHISRLSPIQSYASLFTSSSGMTWEKELADSKDRTLQKVIACVPCYTLHCLPNEAAARLCASVVRKEEQCNG